MCFTFSLFFLCREAFRIACLQFSTETTCSYRKPILFMLLFLMGLSRVNLLTPSLQTIFYQWVRRYSILRFRNLTKVGESQCSSSNWTKCCSNSHRTDRISSHYSNYRRVETLALLFALLTYKFNFFIVCRSPTYVGEKIPHTPLGGDIKQARAKVRARIGRSAVQIRIEQTASRAIIPKTAV